MIHNKRYMLGLLLSITAMTPIFAVNYTSGISPYGKKLQRPFGLQIFNFSGKHVAVWGIPTGGAPTLISSIAAGAVPAKLQWPYQLDGIWVFNVAKAPDVQAIVKKNPDPKKATAAVKAALAKQQSSYPRDVKYYSMAGKPMSGGTTNQLGAHLGVGAIPVWLLIGPNMEFDVYSDASPVGPSYGLATLGKVCPTDRSKNFELFVGRLLKGYSAKTKGAFLAVLKHMQYQVKLQKWQAEGDFLNRLIKAVGSGVFPKSIAPYRLKSCSLLNLG